MRRISLSSALGISFALLSTLLIASLMGIYSLVYYRWLDEDFKQELIATTHQIVNTHLVHANGQIRYVNSNTGETLGELLRRKGLSAIIFDRHLNRLGTYGIYRDINPDLLENNPEHQKVLLQAVNDTTASYEHLEIPGELFFETLTTPIVFNNQIMGVIQLAQQASFFEKLISLNLKLLSIIIPISLAVGWLLSWIIIRRLLQPLRKLIIQIKSKRTTNLPQKVKVKQQAYSEIHTLLTSYNSMIDRLTDVFEKQQYFVNHASHELKTPLTRAISDIDVLLLNEHKSGSAKPELKQLRQDLLSLNDIIESLLDLSSSNQLDIKPGSHSTSLANAIDQIVRIHQKDLAKNQLKLIKRIAAVNVDIAPEHLKIMISNLLSNAIKYSPAGESIHINAVPVKNFLSLSISDHGKGIPKKDTFRLFDRFYRGNHQHIQGSGLGMPIVKAIADTYELQILVESAPNQGTTITIQNIPLSPSKKAPRSN